MIWPMSMTGRSAVRGRHACAFDLRHRVQAGRESANRGAFLIGACSRPLQRRVRRSPQSGQTRASGQRRLNRNVAQLSYPSGRKFLLEFRKGVPGVGEPAMFAGTGAADPPDSRPMGLIISSSTGSAAIRALVPSASAVGPLYLLEVQVKIEACIAIHLYYWSRLGPKLQELSAA